MKEFRTDLDQPVRDSSDLEGWALSGFEDGHALEVQVELWI